MRPEELAEVIRRRPFSPLRLHMTDGQKYDIRHPDQIIILRERVDVGVEPDPNTCIVDRGDRIALTAR